MYPSCIWFMNHLDSGMPQVVIPILVSDVHGSYQQLCGCFSRFCALRKEAPPYLGMVIPKFIVNHHGQYKESQIDWMTISANFRYTFIYLVGQCHWNQVLMFSQWINLSHRRRSRQPVRFDEHPELPKSAVPEAGSFEPERALLLGPSKQQELGYKKKIF